MSPAPWLALADTLEALAHALRAVADQQMTPPPAAPVSSLPIWRVMAVRQLQSDAPGAAHSRVFVFPGRACYDRTIGAWLTRCVVTRQGCRRVMRWQPARDI